METGGCHIDEDAYHRYVEDPIGYPPEEWDHFRDETPDDLADAMELDYDSTNATISALDLDEFKPCISECFSSTSSAVSEPIPLEVSGLGGIQPDDNFIVKVQVCHCDNRKATSLSHRRELLQAPYRLSQRSLTSITKDLARSHPIQVPVNTKIVSTCTIQMRPSTVPSPLRFRSPFSSSGSTEEEGVERAAAIPYNSRSRSSRDARPANFFAESQSAEIIESSYASTSSGSDDDSSIDLLAHARELDPDAVAAREREFEFNLLPAGSVAATAGQSSSEFVKPTQQADSDVDSMSVDEDGFSSIADSD